MRDDVELIDAYLDEVDSAMQTTGGGVAPKWALRNRNIRFSDELSTRIQCFPGDYDGRPFYKAFSTWLQGGKEGKRFIICNCFGETKEVPCVLCYYRKQEESRELAARPKVYINAIVLEDFHWVERTTNSGKKFREPTRCAGKDRLGRSKCEYCAAGVEKKFGLNQFLALGPGYWRDLRKVINRVRETCKNCGGVLIPQKYICTSCKVVFADLGTGTVSDTRRKHFEEDKIGCPICGKTGKAKAVYSCYQTTGTSDALKPGCDTPEPCTLFDVPLQLKAVSDGKNSSLVCVNTEADYRFTPMDPRVVEIAKPHDFIDLFGYMPPVEQAELLKRPNPFTGEAGTAANDEVDPYA